MLTVQELRAVVCRGVVLLDSIDEIDWRIAKNAALASLKSTYSAPKRVQSADGDEIIVSYGGLKHSLSVGIPSLEKTLVSLHIEALIEGSKKTRTEPDKRGRKDPDSVSYYETKVWIDGDSHDVSIVVRNHSDGKRHYDHAVIKGKAHQGYSRVGQGLPAGSPARPFSGLRFTLGEIEILVNKSR